MERHIHLSAVIPDSLAGERLDRALAILFSEHSRTRLQDWIRRGHVRINETVIDRRHRVSGGERVDINTVMAVQDRWAPEAIPLQILYEDDALLIVNKEAGIIVHPGAGNPQHTLLNALLHHEPALDIVPRAGIVHRLDKDTSGLMVVARTPRSHTRLVEQLRSRAIKREYQAVVRGVFTAGGRIDQPIGRHPLKRTRMAVVERGRTAVTHYRVLKKFRAHTLVQVMLETGRTHQIRVHMAYLGHPVVGDPVYGHRSRVTSGGGAELRSLLGSFPRQALHACAITLNHPLSGKALCVTSPLPEDMQSLIDALEIDAGERN